MFQLIIFCNISLILFATQRSKKKFINLLKKCLSFWFWWVICLLFSRICWVLNLHQTIRLDNSVAAVNWREEGYIVTLFTSNLAISICCSGRRKSLTPSSPRFGQQVYWMTSSSDSQLLYLLYSTAFHRVKYHELSAIRFWNRDLHQNFALLINTEKLLQKSKHQLTVQLRSKWL